MIPLLALVLALADPRSGPPRRRLPLSLEECLARALSHQPELLAARHAERAAAARVGEAEGAFDPRSTSAVRWTDQNIPEQPAVFGGQVVQPDREEVDLSASSGIAQSLASGGTYNLLFAVNRFRSDFQTFDTTTGQLVDSGFEFSSSSLDLSLTQPLLRGGWTAIAREPIRAAELRRDVAAADRQQRELDLLYDVHVAYWNLAFARDDREVKRFSVELAVRLLEINRRKVEVGASAPVEVYQAETEIAMRREAMMTAENAILSAEDRLKALVFPFEARGEWDFEVLPTTPAPVPGSEAYPAWEEVFESGLARRPDLERARREAAQAELALFAAENAKMPRLDAEGRIGLSGVDDRIRRTFDDTFSGDHPVHSVGLVLDFPLGNVAAKGREAAAREDLAAARVRLRGLENTLAEEARSAVRELRYLVQKRAAAEKSRDLAERQLRAGAVKFEAGAATNFEVLQLQEDLSEAMTNEKAALLDHAKALANLERVQGTLHL